MTRGHYGALVFAWPTALPLVIAHRALIGWSRVALGHHYVSDVVIGTVFGAAIAGSVSALLY